MRISKLGRSRKGLPSGQGLALVDQTGERVSEAELYRLKGELILDSKIPSGSFAVQKEAEECLHHALAIARDQSAKSWELRAVMSLSRLWQHQGKRNEARRLLTPSIVVR